MAGYSMPYSVFQQVKENLIQIIKLLGLAPVFKL